MRLVELVKRYTRVFVPSRVWQKASESYRGEGAKATVVQLSPDYPSSPGLIDKGWWSTLAGQANAPQSLCRLERGWEEVRAFKGQL